MVLLKQTCAHHPDRPGQATCMDCRRVICQECATTWDGIHYCRPCLAARRRTAEEGRPILGWILVAAATAGLFAIAIPVAVWGAVLVLG